MKIQVRQQDLADALGVVTRIVPKKSTLPILSNVLLETGDASLTLSSTNLEVASQHRVEARVTRPGRVTLPAQLLGDYVALLDHDQVVTLDQDEKTQKVHLECGRYVANIAGITAEDWPAAPSATQSPGVALDGPMLQAMIASVAFAAAAEDSRPVLAGVLLRIANNTFTMAAADGFRLAVRSVGLDKPVDDVQVIVPARTMIELGRQLPTDPDGVVNVHIAPNASHIGFSFGTTEMTSRLVDGSFPDYERIIPKEPKTVVTLQTADLLRATRAAAVFARDNSMIIRLFANPGEGDAVATLKVASTSVDQGDNEGTLDATVDGGKQEIAFNGKYLKDAVDAIDTKMLEIAITGTSSPGILRPHDPQDDAQTTFVIMPMSVAH